MSRAPSRDAVEFATAVALGAVLGWAAVTALKESSTPPGRHRLESDAGGSPVSLPRLKQEARRLAVQSGEELAKLAIGKIRKAMIGPGTGRGR